MDAKECRFCEHSQDFNQPPDKTLCMKKRKIMKRHDTCECFTTSGLQNFLNELKDRNIKL